MAVAHVFDDATATAAGMPGWYMPCLSRQPMLEDRNDDDANPTARPRHSRTVEFLHPSRDGLTALIEAGSRIDRFQEHDSVTWKMFANMVKRASGQYAWPDKPWPPLSYSLRATKP